MRLGDESKAEKHLFDFVTHVNSLFGIRREIADDIAGHIGAECGGASPGVFVALTPIPQGEALEHFALA